MMRVQLTSTLLLIAVISSACYAECPEGWLESLHNTCLKISTEAKTWNGAQAACRSLGAQLVSLEDNARQSVTKAILFYLNNNEALWIGLKRSSAAAAFYWQGYSRACLTVSDWSPHEPNNAGGSENCAHFSGSARKWNDLNCQWAIKYICEKRI